MQAMVLDVSACLPWCFEDEATQDTDWLLDRAVEGAALHVPAIWPLELSNALLSAERRGRIDGARVEEFLAQISVFNLRRHVSPSSGAMRRIVKLARLHKLTTYDASYLDLAIRLGLPLATFDRDLRAAAQKEKLGLIFSVT